MSPRDPTARRETARPPRIRGVHHVALPVRDLSRSESFYVETLGLALLTRHADSAGRPRSLWIDAQGGAILMLERVRRKILVQRAGPPVLALAIRRQDRAQWEERLAAACVAVEARSAYTLYLRDPDGHRLGLSHFPDPTRGSDR